MNHSTYSLPFCCKQSHCNRSVWKVRRRSHHTLEIKVIKSLNVNMCISFIESEVEFRGCLCGSEPALMTGLALERGLDFTSPSHGKLLALLAGLDLARMRSLIFSSPQRSASNSECAYVETSSPSRRDLG